MSTLKNLAFLALGVTLIIALFSGAVTIIVVGVALIVLFKVIMAAFFAATAVKAYFTKSSD